MKFFKTMAAALSFSALLLLSACGQSGVSPHSEAPITESPTPPPRTVRVAVIDTGISPDAIPAEYIAEGANYLAPDKTTADTYGHGTAVASVILDSAESVILVPLVSNVYDRGKISFVDSETFAQIIRDAVDVYKCGIINISAGLVLDKDAVREAVSYAEEAGVLIVASAGNDYRENPGQRYYPAAYDTVLAVGSLAANGVSVSEFSQRASWVDVFAVGEDIPIATLSGGSRTESGSSFAAARITAEAVKILQDNKALTPAQLREHLCKSNTPVIPELE